MEFEYCKHGLIEETCAYELEWDENWPDPESPTLRARLEAEREQETE